MPSSKEVLTNVEDMPPQREAITIEMNFIVKPASIDIVLSILTPARTNVGIARNKKSVRINACLNDSIPVIHLRIK